MQDGSQKDGSSLRLGGWNATEGLLLKQKLAIIRQHQRGDIAKFQAADLDHVEPGGRRSDGSVGGLYVGDKCIARRVDAEPGDVACRQRHDRRASIDHKVDAAAIDSAIDVKMALGVAIATERGRAPPTGAGTVVRTYCAAGAGAGPILER